MNHADANSKVMGLIFERILVCTLILEVFSKPGADLRPENIAYAVTLLGLPATTSADDIREAARAYRRRCRAQVEEMRAETWFGRTTFLDEMLDIAYGEEVPRDEWNSQAA